MAPQVEDEVPERYRDRNGVWSHVDTELEMVDPSEEATEEEEEPAPTEQDDASSYVSLASGNHSRYGRANTSSEERQW